MTRLQIEWHGLGARDHTVSVVTERSPVRDLLCRPAVAVAAEASLVEAARLMEVAHVSAVLVAGPGGIVTERDLARALAHDVDPSETLAAVATPDPVVVPADMAIVDACAVMLNEDVRHLVVDDGDQGLGVVSIREVAAVLLQSTRPDLWLTSLRATFDMPAENWLG